MREKIPEGTLNLEGFRGDEQDLVSSDLNRKDGLHL
jgi:hypothetical protein